MSKCLQSRSARTVKATFGVQSTVAVYTNHVFGGWDYAITNPKAAYVKKANLHREFKVCLKGFLFFFRVKTIFMKYSNTPHL